MAAQTPAILQMLSGAASPQTAGLAQIRETVAKLRALKDPKAGMQMLMQQMTQNNPAMSQALQYIKENGGDPKAACEKLATERGIDLKELGL